MENCQFSTQIEKLSTFQDGSQIQALFKVCGNHDKVSVENDSLRIRVIWFIGHRAF